jgi:hypothetical protein
MRDGRIGLDRAENDGGFIDAAVFRADDAARHAERRALTARQVQCEPNGDDILAHLGISQASKGKRRRVVHRHSDDRKVRLRVVPDYGSLQDRAVAQRHLDIG